MALLSGNKAGIFNVVDPPASKASLPALQKWRESRGIILAPEVLSSPHHRPMTAQDRGIDPEILVQDRWSNKPSEAP